MSKKSTAIQKFYYNRLNYCRNYDSRTVGHKFDIIIIYVKFSVFGDIPQISFPLMLEEYGICSEYYIIYKYLVLYM